MKKENIQSRNRKLSAKARKKHNSFAPVADMLKPLEKMYGSYAGMAGMSSYYMPHAAAASAAAGVSMPGSMHHTSPGSSNYAATAGMHMMAASTAALGGFGAAGCPPSFGGMVSKRRGGFFMYLNGLNHSSSHLFCSKRPACLSA